MTNRETLLADINDVLNKRNLKSIAKLGDSSKGEIEILKLLEIYDHSSRFFTDVKFEVRFPNGNTGAFTVRFNANGINSDGAVLAVLINGKFAVVKQWRLPLGRWTYELPRGFGGKLDAAFSSGALGALKIGDLPLDLLTRELGAELMESAALTSVAHLGNVAENSGTTAVEPSYFLAQLTVPADKLDARMKLLNDGMGLQLWEAKRLLRRSESVKLNDNHSIVGATLALDYLELAAQIANRRAQ